MQMSHDVLDQRVYCTVQYCTVLHDAWTLPSLSHTVLYCSVRTVLYIWGCWLLLALPGWIRVCLSQTQLYMLDACQADPLRNEMDDPRAQHCTQRTGGGEWRRRTAARTASRR